MLQHQTVEPTVTNQPMLMGTDILTNLHMVYLRKLVVDLKDMEQEEEQVPMEVVLVPQKKIADKVALQGQMLLMDIV